MNQQQKQGQVGNIEVLNSMRSVVAQQRANGQTTVPIAWVDSWIASLDAQYGGGYRPYVQPYVYPTQFPFFHPIDTFVPFGTTFRFRVTQSTTG